MVAPYPNAMTDDPESWRAGWRKVNKHYAGAPGFPSASWPEIYAMAAVFLEEFADRARMFGWTGLDLFGCHAEAGGARVDCCGALLLGAGGRAAAIDRDVITFGNTVYPRVVHPIREPRVLIWDWGNKRGPK